jgi:hypothetical protein
MGFMTAVQRPQVYVVHTSRGRAVLDGFSYPKASVWVLEDGTVILCVPEGLEPNTKGVSRIQRQVADYAGASTWSPRAKMLTLELDSGETLTMDSRGCGCGLGAVGNAGPVLGPYEIVRVRNPTWFATIQ